MAPTHFGSRRDPRTWRSPRFTGTRYGYPLRRLLIGSKIHLVVVRAHGRTSSCQMMVWRRRRGDVRVSGAGRRPKAHRPKHFRRATPAPQSGCRRHGVVGNDYRAREGSDDG